MGSKNGDFSDEWLKRSARVTSRPLIPSSAIAIEVSFRHEPSAVRQLRLWIYGAVSGRAGSVSL